VSFDQKAADRGANWLQSHCRHSKGEWAGKPLHLEPWQRERLIDPIFGTLNSDGSRQYRQVFCGLPRKNGKTTLAAGVGLALLIGDNEPGAEVYSVAGNADQANIVWGEAAAMISQSPSLSEVTESLKSALYVPDLRASWKALTKSAKTKHGLNPHGVIGDEVHVWKDREQYDVMSSAVGARRQPLEFYITTAGTDQNLVCWELWQYALKVADGTIHDPTFLSVIFAADDDDDPFDPVTWAKSNPNLGVSVKLDYLAKRASQAGQIATQLNAFKQLHLNIWCEATSTWISTDTWRGQDMGAPFDEAMLYGRKCYAGVDLAWTRDMSAVAYVFPPCDSDDQWRILMRYFLPEAAIAQRSGEDMAPYDVWARDGHIALTNGNVTDFNAIEAQIVADAAKFQVVEVCFDAMFAGATVNNLMQSGFACVGLRQGFISLNAPTQEFERLALTGRFAHGDNPVLRWNLSNVRIERDAAGNIKPSKAKSTGRIDGVAAVINAIARALNVEPIAVSPWEDPNFSLGGVAA
jgi:phage terminase large subunit-like protein